MSGENFNTFEGEFVGQAQNCDSPRYREEFVVNAKMAHIEEKYNEMAHAMKIVISFGSVLSPEERDLLSTAYKNVMSARRVSWNIIRSIENLEETKGNNEKMKMVVEYRNQVAADIQNICNDILCVLDKNLIPCADNEGKAFYYKMKADYHSYLADFSVDNLAQEAIQNSLAAYKAAWDIVNSPSNGISPTNPIRLSVALNYSVFYHDKLESPGEAARIANNAYSSAFADIDTLSAGSQCVESMALIRLLKKQLDSCNNPKNAKK